MYIIFRHCANLLLNMQTTSYSSLRKTLSSFMDKIQKDREVLHITRKGHESMVMMSEHDFNSMQETLHLLSNTANAERLNQSFIQAENGEFIEVEFDEKA